MALRLNEKDAGMTAGNVRSGGCLCGSVRFAIHVPEARFNVCHCGMCRRWCGGPFLAVHCEAGADFASGGGLAWYRSSKWGERGFCRNCGTSLFWRLADDPAAMLAVSAEAFDDAADLKLDRHIYIDHKPARYDFADDRPRLTEAEILAEFGATPGA